MEKKVWIGLIVVLLIVIIMIFNGNRASEEINELSINEVCFGDDCFNVEIADTNDDRARGLMFRESLCDSCGMLFIYDKPGDRKFWMKNTLIPLDIIWLDSDYKVIYIANAVPCVTEECRLYGPEMDSNYILEINSGISSEIGLEIGSELGWVYSQ
jgi:hypothetical protein